MHAWLTVEDGKGIPSRYKLAQDHPATLGRHRKNSIVVDDELVSRQHAEVYHQGGQWFIRNINALNGTRVNGAPVGDAAPLADGHLVGLGNTSLRFRLEPDSDGNCTL